MRLPSTKLVCSGYFEARWKPSKWTCSLETLRQQVQNAGPRKPGHLAVIRLLDLDKDETSTVLRTIIDWKEVARASEVVLIQHLQGTTLILHNTQFLHLFPRVCTYVGARPLYSHFDVSLPHAELPCQGHRALVIRRISAKNKNAQQLETQSEWSMQAPPSTRLLWSPFPGTPSTWTFETGSSFRAVGPESGVAGGRGRTARHRIHRPPSNRSRLQTAIPTPVPVVSQPDGTDQRL